MLARLVAVLGPLADDFEDAVLHRATFTEIGERRGAGQQSGGVGRALVYMGLEAVQSEFALIDKEQRRTRYR